MSQFAKQGNLVFQTVQKTNTALQKQGGIVKGLASSIGGFYLMHKALDLSTRFLKTNLTNAANMQASMMRMGFVSQYTRNEMKMLADEAERVGAYLPALTT